MPRLGSCPTSLYMRLTVELNPAERPKENDEELPASTVKLGLPYRVSTSELFRDRENASVFCPTNFDLCYSDYDYHYSDDLGLPSSRFDETN